jgi:hypothetical protein
MPEEETRMQPYERSQSKWIESDLAISAWTQRPAIEPAPTVEEPPALDRTLELVESLGAKADAALRALARCVAFDARRAFGCGEERPIADAWCGSPLCPACGEVRAREAGQVARGRWPETIIIGDVSRAPGEGLPGADEVVRLRDAWSRATKAAAQSSGFPRVEPMPRAVITPTGVRFFAPLPIGSTQGEAIAHALSTALPGARVEARPRDEAAASLEEAIAAESRAFEALLRASEDAARWSDVVRSRHRDLRRATVIGGRDALPVPDGRGLSLAPTGCPSHGDGCGEVGVVVRHGSTIVHRGAPVGAKPTRQSLVALTLETAREAIRRVA